MDWIEGLSSTGDGHVTALALEHLVEQLRIANLIALANSCNPMLAGQGAMDAASALTVFHEHEHNINGGWNEVVPEIAEALGIGPKGE